MGLILNPKIKMMKNKKRILIYLSDLFTGEYSSLSFIHPAFAAFLAMFDGERNFDDVAKDFCFVLKREYNEEARQEFENRLEHIAKKQLRIEKVLVEKDTLDISLQKPRYNPMDFIIHSSQVDLDPMNKRIDFPLSVNYNVTARCLMTCKYCYHPKYEMNDYISLERLDVLFDEFAKNGCDYIILSGGDPFDRPDLIEIMTMLYNKGINYFVSTKSYLDKATCKRLKEEAGLKTIQISLDSADPEIAAYLAGMDKDFLERTVETIKNLREVNIPVRAKAVVTSFNIDHLEELLNLCRELDVSNVDLTIYGRSIWNHEENLHPTDEQMERANEVVAKFRETHAAPAVTGGRFGRLYISNENPSTEKLYENRAVCSAGRLGITMLPNGEVSICEQLPYTPEVILGDLRVQSVEEYWNSERVQQYLAPPPREYFHEGSPCRTCADDNFKKCHLTYGRCLRDTYNYCRRLNEADIRCGLFKVDFRVS